MITIGMFGKDTYDMNLNFAGIRDSINKRRSGKVSSETRNVADMLLTGNVGFFVEEAYKKIRTNIMFSLSDNSECKIIAVTSPNQNEGKTTTTVNTAIAFTQIGSKVLLIDTDLRRSSVHKMFSLPRDNGLSEVLCGFITPDKAVRKNVIENLDVIVAGQAPPNPAELLSSPKMKAIIDEYKKQYDYIFIDTAPINVVTDATLLANMVSGMMIVVRQNVTTNDSLAKTFSALEFAGAKVIGVIMNDVQTDAKGKSYKYKKYSYYTSNDENTTAAQ